jgi:hypothetical protein
MSDERKPRHNTIFVNIDRPNVDVRLGRPDEGTPVTFADATTGEVLDLGPGVIEGGVTYPRENKGPKVITRFTTTADAAGIDPNEKLLEYDHVLAVDTNTDPATGKSVAVAVLLKDLRQEPDGWKMEPRFPAAYVFRGPPGPKPEPNPEKFGWREIIERIARSPDLAGNVALFVDSCLNEIPKINARERAIVDGFMLPAGITLLYATSDTGAQHLVGPAAIKLCDAVAKRLMKLTAMPVSADQPLHFVVPVELV